MIEITIIVGILILVLWTWYCWDRYITVRDEILRKAFEEDFPNSWGTMHFNVKDRYAFAEPKPIEKPKKRPYVRKATTRKEKAMPLKKGTSDKTRNANIAKEIAAGKKPAQAVAIGYAVQREAKDKAKSTTKGKK